MNHTFQRRTRLALTALAAAIALLNLSSCSNTTNSYSSICITHFGFDSFPDFEDYTFYIDNFAHKIYNTDSFPFQSEVDSLYPTIVAGSEDGSFTMNGEKWSDKDTMDFSVCPVKMVFTASNGKDSYSYDIYVNVHQQDPDSLQMHRASTLPAKDEYKMIYVEGQLLLFESDGLTTNMYKSYDCINWEGPASVDISMPEGAKIVVKSLSYLGQTAFMMDTKGGLYASQVSDGLSKWTKVASAPYITSLLGVLEGRTYPNGEQDHDALLAIVNKGNTLHHAKFEGYWSNGLSKPSATDGWSCNQDALPEGFPIKSFACCDNYTQTGAHFVTIAGGIDAKGSLCSSTWSIMSQGATASLGTEKVYWAKISTDYELIGNQKDASMFYYDDRLFLYGSKHTEADGTIIQDTTLYVSEDQGISWDEADERLAFRAFDKSSLCRQIIADDLYIYVFAQKNGQEGVWKGYINKALFDK